MLTAELPVLVRVTLWVLLVLRVSLPKLSDVVLGVSCKTGAIPLPLSATMVGEAGALLTSVRLLAELVPDVGVKLTVNVADFPGASVNGMGRPLRPNPVPGPAVCVMFKLAVPGLLSVTVCELVCPTVTFPKLTLPGTTEIAGWTPTPLSAIAGTEFVALLTTEALPVAVPVAVGSKATLKLAACPGDKVTRGAAPLRANPLPVTFT
jgi:hypothetical protein